MLAGTACAAGPKYQNRRVVRVSILIIVDVVLGRYLLYGYLELHGEVATATCRTNRNEAELSCVTKPAVRKIRVCGPKKDHTHKVLKETPHPGTPNSPKSAPRLAFRSHRKQVFSAYLHIYIHIYPPGEPLKQADYLKTLM